MRTPHALEIPFVFDNVETSRPFVGTGDGPQAMAEQMSGAWIAFARSGNPNHGALPDWPAYDNEQRFSMIFNEASEVRADFGRVERDTFGRWFYG